MTNPLPIYQSLREWMDVFMHRSMRGWMHFARSSGLSMPQFSILMQLQHRGSCGMSVISERFDITAAAASQLVDKLVQAGYIERDEDPNDRRAKLLRLTESGETLINQGIEERHRWMNDLVNHLSEKEKSKVSEALGILTEAAQQFEDKQ
ncbi:MAG: MarR family transcriptional regulator [Anaerolineales bacterium]|nr:MarR family transcriptional regulator [Anaerolineales bacterium]MCB9109852.1 MarR family transcriptional regulator [Anaerolineales bacterium]